MNYLITGGAGFVGSHLCESLLAKGHQVLVMDDLSTGNISNVDHLLKNPNFQLVVESVHKERTLEALIKKCDFVYHLAAAVGVKLIVTDPIRTIETNIKGTEAILKKCNRWRKPLLFTSTSEVYGKNKADRFSETDDMLFGSTTHARWSYACSKAIDEFLILAYAKRNKLPSIIVRLFNTVGPRQSGQYGMVIPTFVKQALENKDITVYSDGSQTRTFCHVQDVVWALCELPKHSSCYGQVYNIGGTQEISILELAQLIKARTQSQSKIIHLSYDQAYEPGFEYMKKRVPNISKIQNTIAYKPQYNLDQIIDMVSDYFRSNQTV